ncbi:MAG: hypothetical protein CVU63_10735, partial [Deltaproteobacteria bacterium HGW-Deltaproteobacteria-20]
MYNPVNDPEDNYEWFELHNPGTTAFSLAGCILSESTRTHTLGAGLTIDPGAFLTLAASSFPGFTPDYVHNRDVMLVNSNGGGITLTCASVVVDKVTYQTGGAWPSNSNGAAISLDPAHYDATINDDGAHWCLATASYGTHGNLGSPGVTNDSCACVPLTACPSPYNCGDISDGCGGTLNCGACTLPQTCGGSGTANVCGQGACVPTSCVTEGAECGSISDGCGNTLSCGSCTAPETCGGGGDDNVCGCTPLAACPIGLNCGDYPNGCGGTISCGSCTAPATCGGGGTDNVCGLPQPGAGQVIFTEIMPNPVTVDDTTGEWFELHNPTSSAFSLRGCSLTDNTGSYAINTDLDIPAGGYVALARGASPGFTPDLVYTGLALANTGDELHLTCSSTLIDEVVFGSGFPLAAGVAMNLDPASSSSTANNLAANWCAATESYNGDLGTPGAANTTCACTPLSSCPAGLNCGDYPDGCGSTISCGSCTSPQTCGGSGTNNVCGCTPLTSCPGTLDCGDYSDGCGGTLNCGTCESNETCTNNVCACVPLTACPGTLDCGSYSDGCGGTLNCGTCESNETCTNNVCTCVPLTACPGTLDCGSYSDGCGGTLNCGTCESNETCTNNVCTCVPLTACPAGLNCGTYDNGCGGTLNCGTCTDPLVCAGGGTPNVCGLPQPGVGQVILSEIMVDSTTVGEPGGEWFELHNPSTAAFNLEGCVVADNAGSFTITGALIIPSGGYLALARSAAPGFTPDYVYPTISLNNTGGD